MIKKKSWIRRNGNGVLAFVLRSAVLKINHIAFWWYYARVPKFFHQWTLLKSISLFKQNYEHLNMMYEGNQKMLRDWMLRNEKLEAELRNTKVQQVATDEQIRWANKNFGTKWTPPTEN